MANHSITVPAGVTTFDVLVQSIVDNEDESNETYTLQIGNKTGTGTIIDNTPVVVASISDAIEREFGYNRHHVVLSATPTSPVDLNLSFENITASDNDYDRVPTFDTIPGGSIVLNDAADTITVTGLKEFDVFVYLEPDNISEPAPAEEYRIILGGQSAIGGIQDGN